MIISISKYDKIFILFKSYSFIKYFQNFERRVFVGRNIDQKNFTC
jgi:hypothetical protein